MKTKYGWSRADAMTEAQIHQAALGDPDAQPLTADRLARMNQTPRLKIIRRALGLTQEEFAARFQIPLGTLRHWEQGGPGGARLPQGHRGRRRGRAPSAASRARLTAVS